MPYILPRTPRRNEEHPQWPASLRIAVRRFFASEDAHEQRDGLRDQADQELKFPDSHRSVIDWMIDTLCGAKFPFKSVLRWQDELPVDRPTVGAHPRGESLMAAMRADGLTFAQSDNGHCYYTHATDTVRMNERDRFLSQEAYYYVVLHEIGHATGAAHRLNRESITRRCPTWAAYWREEIVAEFVCASLAAQIGMGFESPAGKLMMKQRRAWVSKHATASEEDKTELRCLAIRATLAAEYVLAKERELDAAIGNTDSREPQWRERPARGCAPSWGPAGGEDG